MSINLYLQSSLGCYPFKANKKHTIKVLQEKLIQSQIKEISHVSLNNYRLYANRLGIYLNNQSHTVFEAGLANEDILILVRKQACPDSEFEIENEDN